MLRNGYKIGIFTALLFLLAHSFVPHSHSEQQQKSSFFTHTSNHEFHSLLEMIFSEDIGENHLENYEFQPQLAISHVFLLETLKTPSIQCVNTFTNSDNQAIVEVYPFSFPPFRGPPATF